ncbi:STAS domain-containing protein [Actinoplanes sp. KI2]|uniref:STAS domain-containing protein n=1 Tax=Actinoplanes sp. KI2 TaxID=2983315 RepID=UPI0021D57798|nr:STAS domain-containing protein [Actinoplanes sp. KI2]MCU7727988.1 STAS domain-containing protein [Actinoplanes sp. KI2]
MVAERYAYQSSGDRDDELSDAVTVTDSDGVMLLRVSWCTESAERARVVVEGDIDRDTAAVVGAVILDALAHRPVVCCDFRLTSYFGSAAVEALARAHLAAGESGRTVLLTGIAGLAERVLRVTGMLEVLAVEQ